MEDKVKVHVMIPFQVKEEDIEKAKAIINDLISKIRENEPGTLVYESMQLRNDPTSFIHFMIFADEDAHNKHRGAPYMIEFVKSLYGLCPNEPFPIFLDSFASCGTAFDDSAS
jgi:quinol monooxygenase YgiN